MFFSFVSVVYAAGFYGLYPTLFLTPVCSAICASTMSAQTKRRPFDSGRSSGPLNLEDQFVGDNYISSYPISDIV